MKEVVLKNLLLIGSPGSAKTAARALCNGVGLDSIQINCSENDDIDPTIREFISTVSFNGNKPKCIIIIDSDNLSEKSQRVLLGLIEEFSSHWFICIANHECNFYDFLKSRLTIISTEE